jgi:hypothetical protein
MRQALMMMMMMMMITMNGVGRLEQQQTLPGGNDTLLLIMLLLFSFSMTAGHSGGQWRSSYTPMLQSLAEKVKRKVATAIGAVLLAVGKEASLLYDGFCTRRMNWSSFASFSGYFQALY